MPRFFFDVADGERSVHDEVGIELAQARDAEHEARELLLALGEAAMVEGRRRLFSAHVRDAGGRTIYRGSVTLRIERVDR